MRRGRYAPTPSGNLHIGNIGTALIAWLDIRSAGGTFVLRMEDIDRPRCKREYADTILDDLRWIGIDWDEGPDIGGIYGPYVQSERLAMYDEALRSLIDEAYIYPCFCSRAQLMEVASAPHGLASEGTTYPGTCRTLTHAEQRDRAKQKTPSFRFRISDQPLRYTDGLFGTQSYPGGYGGDFIVKRADHIFAYQLAVVVDDAAMNITRIVRGADLLDSTPRQIRLYEALHQPIPQFTHIPLLYMEPDVKLSKRHREGITSIVHMRRSGVAREDLIGWLAYLYGQIATPERLSIEELLTLFRMDRIPRRSIIMPREMLTHLYNGTI